MTAALRRAARPETLDGVLRAAAQHAAAALAVALLVGGPELVELARDGLGASQVVALWTR